MPAAGIGSDTQTFCEIRVNTDHPTQTLFAGCRTMPISVRLQQPASLQLATQWLASKSLQSSPDITVKVDCA